MMRAGAGEKEGDFKYMKKAFFQFKTAFVYQIVLWVFPVFLALLMMALIHEKTGEDWQGILIVFVVSTLLLNLPVVLTLQRVHFTDDAVLVKLGWLTLQRIPRSDIKTVRLFQRQSGQITVQFYYFSVAGMRADEVNRAWERSRCGNSQIIFCEANQKGLRETLLALFPQQFDPAQIVSYPENEA